MFEPVGSRLMAFADAGDPDILLETRIGLEKESLRVAATGGIATTPHPKAWGAPLTHPWLTTDYSEALAEFITPPCLGAGEALDFLADMQSYAYRQLQGEILWATSMPCVLSDEQAIPIAQYGDSNMGKMKHLYRVGLGNRYGRVMQVIAGVHFNWSLPDGFWPIFARLQGSEDAGTGFQSAQYMSMIRNLLRTGWLIPYLFGASPAVCKSFFKQTPKLPSLDEYTYYEPYATSLRMGDIGYQNSREAGLGIRANYDSVERYADSLLQAITTPAELWQRIGVKVDGEYRQLNANILQIENEYYSSVRPKPLLQGLESPALALKRRGVRYIELRSLDVNAYHPLGVDEVQLRFLETWMLAALFADSPTLTSREHLAHNQNLLDVAHRGREPGLKLNRDGRTVGLAEWGQEILQSMLPVAEALDRLHGGNDYEDALDDQLNKILYPELTPSARMLNEMSSNGESFYHFAHRLSLQHHHFFTSRDLNPELNLEFEQAVSQSFRDQDKIESRQEVPFDQFLTEYFAPSYAEVAKSG